MAKSKKPTIDDLIVRTIVATRQSIRRESKDVFKATEKRLYAYPVILLKIQDDEETLDEVRRYGVHERSKSIVRFIRSGSRLTEDEIKEGVLLDLTAKIADDKREIETIDKALKIIEDDPYFNIVKMKYFEDKTDDEIGTLIYRDPKTVRTHKSRLVGRLSVFLYGAEAVT
jgi:hypothetical protein